MAADLPILSERTRRVLATLVREHIETGEPVASQTLVRRGGFGLSSATIRNVLAQLEELGYLRQPHTSAGRVPTDLGYRSYVDLLLKRPRTSRSTSPRGRAYFAADKRFSASLSCVLLCPIGGIPLILNGADGTP